MAMEESKSVAEKIRLVRQEKGISVEELANQAGCSAEYLEWVEDGQIEPPVALLLQLAEALDLDAVSFLHHVDTSAQRLEEVAKRTEHYSYKTLTPPEADKHLMAFLVNIPPKTSHEGVGYSHEGEEFVFVVSGEVEVTVEQEKRRLSKNDSFRFKSHLDHHLSNPGGEEAELLVVLYIP
jgi:transcriptional regulator with XRE-family HTH domain